MKATFKILTVLSVILTSCMVYSGRTSQQSQSQGQGTTVSFQVFYDQLSPYGQWVDDSNYGYVWIPNSGSDFAPYSSDGHWVLTDYGWTWASDYSWGWATFHYGRWSFNDSFGWFWVPDNEWGPAWVNWRQADGYYGWEPMQPGMTVSMSFNRRYDSNNDHWLFVSNRDFERTDVNRYSVNRNDRDRIARNSTVINNTYLDNTRRVTYITGPSRNDVQRNTGRTIVPLTIYENNKPGQQINNGQLRIYRPQVQKRNESVKAAPTTIINQRDVRRTSGGDGSTIQNGNATRQQNTDNQQNNIGNQPQNRTVAPNSPDRNYQPMQQPKSNPAENNQPARQPNVVVPQRDVVQPAQPQNRTTPPVPEQRIKTVEPSKPTPADNNRPDRQPNVPPQQNNNPQPTQQRNMNQQDNNQQRNQQPSQQRDVVPQNNNPQPAQQRNTNQQDNNQQRNTQPPTMDNRPQQVQQQNSKPSTVENGPQQVQPRNSKPANIRKTTSKQPSIKQEIKKEQVKEPDKVTEPSVQERK